MSGDKLNQDDDDFLDDFVIDDEVMAESQDAEAGADSPGLPAPSAAARASAGKRGAKAAAPPKDSDDFLFEDHTRGLKPSEHFAGKEAFSESAASSWDAESGDLDAEVGIPLDDEHGTPVELGIEAASLAEAEASFTEELDSLLQSEENLTLDSEQELEIVGDDGAPVEAVAADDADDAVADTFVLADGESCWEEEEGVAASAADAEGEDASADYFSNLSTAARGGSPGENEVGWEPLPGTHIDDLAEVDGVDLVDEPDENIAEATQWDDADEAIQPARAQFAAVGSDVEGHDIYAEVDEEPEVVGAYRPQNRLLGTFAAMAASLAVVAGAALAVYRPEWFGLRHEPAQVEVVEVQRPRIQLDLAPPPMPVSSSATTQPETTPTPSGGTDSVQVPPVVVPPPMQPTIVVAEPPKVVPTPVVTPPTQPVVAQTQPVTGPETTPQVVVEPSGPTVVPVPGPLAPDVPWPVAVAGAPQPGPANNGATAPVLMRVGENLLVGEPSTLPVRQAADGVLPGTRAFAQLHNGNYFIGSVKAANSQFLTLKIATGEVSIAREHIARLAELGSADYDELQKATSGFVRLTNNNRLVGAILGSIADDHIILETRSNRVMLPKSAVGEIVQTGGDTGVKIDTTREEDDWLRRMSERQLGAKSSAAKPAPSANGRVK